MNRPLVVVRWVGALALAAIAGSCHQAGAPDDTTTVRSAVNSNVLVTVRDGANALQANVEVFAVKTNGSIQTSAFTNASGVATLSLPASSYSFKATEAGSDFFSGAAGHCTTPSCTTAQITITRVDVTVVLTNGTPLADRSVWWETPGGQTGGYVNTGANGHALIAVPAGSYAFFQEVNGWEFPSGSAGHCVVPGCTAATIVETAPVTVTVTNTSGVPQPDEQVFWHDGQGAFGGGDSTDASGILVVSVPAGPITFTVGIPGGDFSSATCQVPGCTVASITMSAPITVTVVDTGGAPMSGKAVSWETAAAASGPGGNTNASGVVAVTPPLEVVRFKVTVDGTTFYSAASANCVQPACSSATILVSQQSVVTVVDGSGNPISGRAVTPTSTEGITSSNKTTNASGQATFRLPFAHWQFKAKCSGNNETFYSGNAGHCFIPGGCLTAKIKMPCGQCTGKANGFACDDQNPCTGSSSCQSQFCTGGSPTSCSASDQCHDVGACGVEMGTCSNPPKTNGTSCSDGNGCTQTDTCQSGTCAGANPVTCVASDQCHDAGTCASATGVCSNPAKTNGTACNDSNACTQGDVCTNGACGGSTTYTCSAPDTCHDAGTCSPSKPAPGPPSTQDLIGWWKLDGDGVDSSGHGHDLTITGSVTAAPGRFGRSMAFDGTGCMSAPASNPPAWDDARMVGADGVTLMAWVRQAADYTCPSAERVIMGRGWDYSIGTSCLDPGDPGTTGWVTYSGGSLGYPAGWGQIYSDHWVFYAMTWDHHTVRNYFNGMYGNSYADEFGSVLDAGLFAIGCMQWDVPGKYFKGQIDEAMLYRRALSDAEIASYYAASDPCTHPVHADGSTCSDGNLCTQTDTCQGGACVGSNPVVCTAQD